MIWPLQFLAPRRDVPSAVAQHINMIVAAVNSLRPVQSPGSRTAHTTSGVVRLVSGAEASGGAGSVGRFKVTAIGDDRLTCRRVVDGAGTLAAGSTVVALPTLLRRDGVASRNGFLYEYLTPYADGAQGRTAKFSNGASVKEEIFPAYKVDDFIFAGRVGPAMGVANVVWIDLNVDGRGWAPAYRETQVCEDGVPKLSKVVRSTTYAAG